MVLYLTPPRPNVIFEPLPPGVLYITINKSPPVSIIPLPLKSISVPSIVMLSTLIPPLAVNDPLPRDTFPLASLTIILSAGTVMNTSFVPAARSTAVLLFDLSLLLLFLPV